MMCPKNQEARKRLLQQINEVSFALDDILLYLDTHPEDEKAIAYYRENAEKRKGYMDRYAAEYGPLTIDSGLLSDSCSWKWALQPFPWEKGV